MKVRITKQCSVHDPFEKGRGLWQSNQPKRNVHATLSEPANQVDSGTTLHRVGPCRSLSLILCHLVRPAKIIWQVQDLAAKSAHDMTTDDRW